MSEPVDKRAQTARTLLWLAGTLLVIGAVLSPSAGLLAAVVAALAALAALALGTRRAKIVAAVLLALSAALAVECYPEFRVEQERLRQRAQEARP